MKLLKFPTKKLLPYKATVSFQVWFEAKDPDNAEEVLHDLFDKLGDVPTGNVYWNDVEWILIEGGD